MLCCLLLLVFLTQDSGASMNNDWLNNGTCFTMYNSFITRGLGPLPAFIHITNTCFLHSFFCIEFSLIHQEINSLRSENRNQNIQIALLQDKVGLQGDDESSEPSKKVTDDAVGDFHHHVQERPARLLPFRYLFDRKNNETDDGTSLHQQLRRFYGPPTNCSDLSQLGYTLNGFYMVKSEADLLGTTGLQLETVFCTFKQPESPFNKLDV